MKDYQLYLEKITNALSRAGISYPAPSFSDYEGMWSYVEGLSSFLEMNAQLQKAGAGVVLMGLEESTTFKSYWNSEFYQEFQERKLLESKISSNSKLSEFEGEVEETQVLDSAEFSSDSGESDSKTKGIATGLVVGSVVGSTLAESLGSSSSGEGSESKLEGYDSSNIVFVDDDSDLGSEEDSPRYNEDGFLTEDDDEPIFENSGSVEPPSLEGYDSSNIVFVDDDEYEEESNSEEVKYDEDGFVIIDDDDEESSDSLEDGYTYDEYGNKYDQDGFLIEDDDSSEDKVVDEFSGDAELVEDNGYTYDEFGNKFDSDGFLVEEEDDDSSKDISSEGQGGISKEPDGSYYDENGNHFDADGFLIDDDDEPFEESDEPISVSDDGSYYDENGNHFDADGFLIDDEDSDDFEEEPIVSKPTVEPDGSYYDEDGNHFDADGFLIEDEEDSSEEESSSSSTLPDGSYYDDDGNHYDADGFLIEDEEESEEPYVEEEPVRPQQRVSSPKQREVHEEERLVTPPLKPKIIMPKEVQAADKILSLFGGMEDKLRKKVQDVKKPKN